MRIDLIFVSINIRYISWIKKSNSCLGFRATRLLCQFYFTVMLIVQPLLYNEHTLYTDYCALKAFAGTFVNYIQERRKCAAKISPVLCPKVAHRHLSCARMESNTHSNVSWDLYTMLRRIVVTIRLMLQRAIMNLRLSAYVRRSLKLQ